MKMQPFDEHDFFNYPDAQSYQDGTPPMIYQYGPLTLVCHYLGIRIELENGEAAGWFICTMEREYQKDMCNEIIKKTRAKSHKQMHDYFTHELGLQPNQE